MEGPSTSALVPIPGVEHEGTLPDLQADHPDMKAIHLVATRVSSQMGASGKVVGDALGLPVLQKPRDLMRVNLSSVMSIISLLAAMANNAACSSDEQVGGIFI